MACCSPTRPYYGYVVLCCCALCLIAASPGHSFMIGLFTDSFMSSCGVTRSVVSTIWTVTLIASSVYVNIIGRLVDRFGAPFIVRCAVLPFCLTFVSFTMDNGPASLSASYLALRMLGPETIDFSARICVPPISTPPSG